MFFSPLDDELPRLERRSFPERSIQGRNGVEAALKPPACRTVRLPRGQDEKGIRP